MIPKEGELADIDHLSEQVAEDKVEIGVIEAE